MEDKKIDTTTAEEPIVGEPAAKKPKLDTEDVKSDHDSHNESANDETNGDKAPDATQLDKDIIDQIEYYFGDSNLFRDKFLQSETTKNDGWVGRNSIKKLIRIRIK